MTPVNAVDGPQRGDEQRRERAEVRHPQPQHRGPQEEPQPQPGVAVERARSDQAQPLISVQAWVQSWYVVHSTSVRPSRHCSIGVVQYQICSA